MNNFILWIMDIYQKMMDLVSEALPWLNEQYKNLIIGGSGVILIYILYKLFLAGSNRQEYKLPPPDKPLKPKEKEQYRKIADKLAQKGEFIKAGDLYRIIGDASRAIEMYKKSGKTMMAAQIAIDFDLHEIAAALLENMSKCLEAAEEWAKAGNFAKAAECYLKEKSFIKAAETLSKAKQHEKAGDIYIQGGYFDKAATEYIAAKNYKKAAQAFLKLYYSEKKNLENNQNVSPGKINALKKLALKCANYLELAGNIEKALEMYEEGGNFNKAAELAGQLEMWEKAAEYYQMGGLPLKAAEIYDRLGDKKRAAQIRVETI